MKFIINLVGPTVSFLQFSPPTVRIPISSVPLKFLTPHILSLPIWFYVGFGEEYKL
jgi:hypothetical protein